MNPKTILCKYKNTKQYLINEDNADDLLQLQLHQNNMFATKAYIFSN